jgi:predicted site-specific integrase-resolvase
MISPEHAARIAGVSTRTIYAWLESGKVHFLDTPEALLLICLDSLTELNLRAGRNR